MSCAISSIALPQRLTTIGESAFLQTELSSITIPVSVTTIDSAAFSYCDNLETIRLLRPYTNKTDYNFLTTGTNSSSAYPSLKEITVPDIESYSGYYLMFKYDDSDVEDILFIYGATNGQANVGLKYTIQSDGTYIISGYNSNLVGAKVLPTTYNGKPVNKIGSNAFSDCVSLTGVVIPSSITAIGSQAFKDCSGLKAITFNRTAAQGITQIETDSFAGCSAIEVINVPDEDSFNAYGMQFIEKDMNLLNILMQDVMVI